MTARHRRRRAGGQSTVIRRAPAARRRRPRRDRIARPFSVRSGSMTSTPSMPRAHGAADEAAGQDRADRRRRRCRLTSASSRADAGEQARRQRLVAEDGAGLHRADRVAADRPVRRPQLDPRQPGGAGGERLEAELEAGRDRAADERAVCARRSRRSWPSRSPRRRPGRRTGGRAASALTRRSAPTSAGRSTRIAMGTVPATGDEDRDAAPGRDRLTMPSCAGTTEASAIALTSVERRGRPGGAGRRGGARARRRSRRRGCAARADRDERAPARRARG